MSTETDFRAVDRRARTTALAIDYNKRPIEERVLDFEEVILGYDKQTAMAEASRCVQCPDPQPCLLNCPAGNDIPEAMWHISQGNFIAGAKVFAATSPLPEVCGRVCPSVCQNGCALQRCNGPISVNKLEAFVSDIARREGLLTIEVPPEKSGKHVAVVGSGPAGLTIAEDLVKAGHSVTVYEAWPYPGGLLIYGIPSFKLDKGVVLNKVFDLEDAGVRFITNTRIGEDISIDLLQTKYDAVFLGTGAGIEATMDIPGEDLADIYRPTEFLIRANVPDSLLPPELRGQPTVGRRVAVIGGGDTAVDCARSAIRLGAQEVTIVYRRTEAEMPGNKCEREIALEEGVQINYLQAPVEYISDNDGRLKGMKVVKMALGEPDRSGRPRPVPIEGSEFIQDVDTVILAVGYWPDPMLGERTSDLSTHKWGLIITNEETGETSREGVFAAGDNVHGPDLVITAIATAHKAADGIKTYLAMKEKEAQPELEAVPA